MRAKYNPTTTAALTWVYNWMKSAKNNLGFGGADVVLTGNRESMAR